jgi:excisionase family DNA binding protein
MSQKPVCPIWEKTTITVEEAAALSSIGENRLRELIKQPECDFVLCIGSKSLIKRKLFERFLERTTVL